MTQAFFAALGDIADGQQAVVASAAVSAIRDALKERRLKMKESVAKAKAKAPAKKAATARRAKAAPAARRSPAAGKRAAMKRAPAKQKIVRKARKAKVAAPVTETVTE